METFARGLGNLCAVIGAQWGDEGKGKIIDILAPHFDVIARAGGGANAGHTIVVAGKKHVFHLLPAGSLHAGKPVVLGAGMVIHLPTLLEEIRTLEDAGVEIISRLHIAANAHVVFEYHKAMDAALEEERMRSGAAIGTTKRGIGPAYMEKAARRGMRMEILADRPETWRAALADRAAILRRAYGILVDVEAECARLAEAQALLRTRVVAHLPDTLDRWLREGKKLLLEGAQGVLLDLDYGTYPFVTSSQTTVAGMLHALGIAPRRLTSCVGVAKTYCTRVGSGGFPTEDAGPRGERLRDRGGEYGATTGRPRRCGWLYIPDLLHAAQINGIDCWNLTKLDVLDEEESIPVGIGMNDDGTVRYETLQGWESSTVGVTSLADLPAAARRLIGFIAERTGIPVRLIGTGPGRDEMIISAD